LPKLSQEYQVYLNHSGTSVEILDKLRDIEYLYLQEVEGEIVYLYLPKDPFLKKKVKKEIPIQIAPYTYLDTNNVVQKVYLQEKDIRKHLYKAKKKKTFKKGDIVYIKEYKDMPFEVKEVDSEGVEVEHRLKHLTLSFKVDSSNLEKRKVDTIFYKSVEAIEPIAKIFLDCDLFQKGDSVFELFSELWVLKTVYNNREVVVMNPMPDQEKLCNLLGLRIYKGYKKAIIYQKEFDKDLDLIYSNNLTYLEKVDSILHLESRYNIMLPKEVRASEVELTSSYGFDDKNYKGSFTEKSLYTELDYMGLRDFIKKEGLKQYLGDLPYYVRIVKT